MANSAAYAIERAQLVSASLALVVSGLNQGTSGNLSIRVENGFLITPSGVPPEALTPEMMVKMTMDGGYKGDIKPSSEWRFHLDLYQTRHDCAAIVHTHSAYASALSSLREDLPAFHYMVAVAGGDSVRCAEYALFGTQALSDAVINAMQSRQACLMANHGLIAIGSNLDKALYIAQEIELLCQQYLVARQVGQPVLLSDNEMRAVFAQFNGYGALAK